MSSTLWIPEEIEPSKGKLETNKDSKVITQVLRQQELTKFLFELCDSATMQGTQ